MKRLFGTFVLLAGLSGCISFTAPPGVKEMRSEAKSDVSPSMVPDMVVGNANTPSLPTMASWTAHPEHQVQSVQATHRPAVDYAASRMAYAPNEASKSAGLTPVPPRTSAPKPQPQATSPQLAPPSALPPVATPAPTPAVATGSSQPPAPFQMPPTMPVVVTPRGEQPAERTTPVHADAASTDNIVPASRTEPVKPGTPAPSVKQNASAEVKPGKAGAPLMRLVNTKRITLNFEVNDVGPSGLSSVELWYTRDCREWKKYNAPTQAQAYVVEVDEEGMYGFTLLAKSGIGLGKEPPVSGDQPQVWVIVDLTKPDVQLTELTPNTIDKTQQVTVGWKASDKNLGRQPISLWYAEKEDGPWKVMASNLENTGKYVWQAPSDTARVLVKVEASDLAGNVARAQWASPIMLDNARPSISIVNVEGAPAK